MREKIFFGVVIGLCFSCLFCSVGTTLWINNNITGSADGPLNLIIIGVISLSGIAGFMAGIIFGGSIILRINPALIYKVILFVFTPVIFTLVFLGATYAIYNLFLDF